MSSISKLPSCFAISVIKTFFFFIVRTEMEEDDKKSSQSQSTSYSRLEIQISKNLFIIFLAYILCLTPQSLCHVISCRIDENYTRHVVLYNSTLNPFIYGFKHPLFREVFIAILRCRQVPEPSSFLRATIRTFKSHWRKAYYIVLVTEIFPATIIWPQDYCITNLKRKQLSFL